MSSNVQPHAEEVTGQTQQAAAVANDASAAAAAHVSEPTSSSSQAAEHVQNQPQLKDSKNEEDEKLPHVLPPLLSKFGDEEKNYLLGEETFDAKMLATAYPPQIHNSNKEVVYWMACPQGAESHSGKFHFSRWRAFILPDDFPSSSTEVKSRPDVFGYEVPEKSNVVEWHMNFADAHLFGFYGSNLFAQDEMQVAEHPILGSLVEKLTDNAQDSQLIPRTTTNGNPTPCLVRGVERRCVVSTNRDAANHRPYGLYGNNFSRASAEAVKRATAVLKPPTISNILAMEALKYGHGKYSRTQIDKILVTAYTGFRAAVIDSHKAHPEQKDGVKVVIHTGHWGCGAFGGNKTLMALVQIAAAHLASVDELVYHTLDAPECYDEARRQLHSFFVLAKQHQKKATVKDFIEVVFNCGYEWGVSDGN